MNKIKNKSKSYSLAILILIMSVSQAFAQNFEIGFRYLPEYSELINKSDNNAGKELQTTSNLSYYSYGLGAVYNFNNNVGLAVDILFSREGQRYTGNFSDVPLDANAYSSIVGTQLLQNKMVIAGDYVAKSEPNFVKIPIMFSFNTDNRRPLFFTLLVGPQINILQSVALEINHSDIEYPNSNITPMDLYQSITIDGMLAIGAAYNISPNWVLSARFRFDYGFNDLENKDLMVSYFGAAPVHFYSPDRQATHNMTMGLMIGIEMKL